MPNESVVEHVFRVKDMVGDAPEGGSTGNATKKRDQNLTQSLKRLIGIDLGLGALLKQSQIFTGYMGNLFSIVGAIIDTVLAPLAPLAFKALAALGKKIPAIAAMAEKHIPRIVANTEAFVKQVGDWFRKARIDIWGPTLLKILGSLIAIQTLIRLGSFSGNLAYSATGIRGAVGVGRGIMGRLSGAGGVVPHAAPRQFAQSSVPGLGTVTHRGANATATGSRFATAGRMLSRGMPIIGAVTSGVMGYAGGRSQGMSQAKSAGRGLFSAGAAVSGAMGGAALGSMIMPGVGTLIGGALGGVAGGFLGPALFDSLFGGGKGGGSRPSNLGSMGAMAGYRVPTFVSESQEAFSKTVLDSQVVLDDYAIEVEATRLAMEQLKGNETEGVLGLAGVFSELDSSTRSFVDNMLLYGQDLATRIQESGGMGLGDDGTKPGSGTGGAGLPEGGLGKDPEVLEEERKKAEEDLNRKLFGDPRGPSVSHFTGENVSPYDTFHQTHQTTPVVSTPTHYQATMAHMITTTDDWQEETANQIAEKTAPISESVAKAIESAKTRTSRAVERFLSGDSDW